MKIFITGHKGMVGSAVYNIFNNENFGTLLTLSKKKLDLLNFAQVNNFIKKKKT